MADVSSTTGASSSSRLIDTTSNRCDQPLIARPPKAKLPTFTTPKHPAAVARRNARERNRVRQVNMGFVTLRNHIPQNGSKAKKLSKVETLRQAANYIRYLRDMLAMDEAMSASCGGSSSSMLSCGNSGANTPDSNNFFYTAPTPPVGTSDAYFGNNSCSYSTGIYSDSSAAVVWGPGISGQCAEEWQHVIQEGARHV